MRLCVVAKSRPLGEAGCALWLVRRVL